MGWESSDMFRFNLWPILQGQVRRAKLKSAYNSLILGLRVLLCQTTLKEIMGYKSSDVFRFDLWPLLQGQTRVLKLKSVYIFLIICPRGLQCETNL